MATESVKTTVSKAEKTGAGISELSNLTSDMEVQDSGFAPSAISPYIWFPNQRSGLWAQALRVHPTLNEQTVCLVDGMKITILTPFRFVLMASQYYLVQEDGQGNAVRTWRESPVGGEDHKLKEWFEALLTVFTEDRATIARCRFSKTKSQAPKIVSGEIAAACSPEWIKGDPARKQASAMPDPKWRVVGDFTLKLRQSRSTGLPYSPLVGVARPITADEMLAVERMTKMEGFRELLERCKKDYTAGLADLNRKLAK